LQKSGEEREGLNITEFEDFIYSGDDSVNVDLKSLKPLTQQQLAQA